jgi:hypothetical protein
MGLFDPLPIASSLINLFNTPGARAIGNQVRSFIPYAGGPFGGTSPKKLMPGVGMGKVGSSYPGSTLKRVPPRATPGTSTPFTPTSPLQNDPLMDLYNQLITQLQAPVSMPTGIDTKALMKQVEAAINPIYNQRSASAKNRTTAAREDVKKMYRALASDYERLAPQQAAQAQKAQKDVEQLYGQLRSNVQGDYSRISKEQADLFKSLGIEAALPEVLSEQNAPIQETLEAAAENQAQNKQRYMDIGNMDQTFYREGSPNATMAGNEISTGMLSQLNDYLGQIDAERASGIQTGYMQELGQAQNLLAQKQQAAQAEAARRQEMLWGMLQQGQQAASSQKQVALTPDSFMSQLPPQMQQSVGEAFTRLQRSPESVYGKVEDKRNPVPGTYVETTPQWYMAQADEMLRRGEIDAVTHQALQMYLQLNYAKG